MLDTTGLVVVAAAPREFVVITVKDELDAAAVGATDDAGQGGG
jgi:hypothetical protein